MSKKNDRVKIYLDQKDYSSIARGLAGQSGYEKYPEIYDYLLNLVESGKISIYFSSFHILESLRYEGIGSELWGYHCEVVDKLTRGSCIVFYKEIEKRELEIFLSNQFHFQTEFTKVDYPYGKYKDAVPVVDFKKIPMGDRVKKQIKKKLSASGYSRDKRRKLEKKIFNPRSIKKRFMEMGQAEFDEFILQTNKETKSNRFVEDFSQFVDRKTFVKFLFGTHFEQRKIVTAFFDKTFQFKNLVQRYGNLFPDLKKMAILPEKSFEKLNPLIKLFQDGQQEFGKSLADYDGMKENLERSFVKDLKPLINKYAKRYKFSAKSAGEILLDSTLKPILILHTFILFNIAYLATHDVKKRARKPMISDTTDLQHLRYIPYVDCFLTDGFFYHLSKDLAVQSYDTRIFKDLVQLQDYLKEYFD